MRRGGYGPWESRVGHTRKSVRISDLAERTSDLEAVLAVKDDQITHLKGEVCSSLSRFGEANTVHGSHEWAAHARR